MRVSKNELTSLYKQALEGCGVHIGTCESAAEMAVWAKMHGINGLSSLTACLAQCVALKSANINLIEQSEQSYLVDVNGATSLLLGGLISDLAYSQAYRTGFSEVKILNCQNRLLLHKQMTDCHKRGMFCLAYGRNVADSKLAPVAVRVPGEALPEIVQFRCQNQIDLATNALVLVYAKHESRLSEHRQQNCDVDSTQIVDSNSPNDLFSNYQRSLDDGIEISESNYAALTSMAERVLVESSEQSRMGAGA